MGFADRLAQDLQYVRHLRGDTLDHVMTQLGLCTVGDLVDRHSLSAALSYQYCEDILSNHMKLTNLEEIQTKIDIAQYDLHYVTLRAEKKAGSALSTVTGAGTAMMTAKLKVKGSSENRPKICLGGEIFLRPVAEDLHKLLAYDWVPQVFEIRGVCVHYQLATEEATFEFPASVVPPQLPFDKLFNALRYHVRFDYERYGFLFVQWAIANIMQNKYLVETLFPSEDTMARLKAYFAAKRRLPAPPPGLPSAVDGARGKPSAVGVTSQSQLAPELTEPDVGVSHLPSSAHGAAPTPAAFNAQQLQAINGILQLVADTRWTAVRHTYSSEAVQDHLPMPPYIIYGPPGTGAVFAFYVSRHALICWLVNVADLCANVTLNCRFVASKFQARRVLSRRLFCASVGTSPTTASSPAHLRTPPRTCFVSASAAT